MKRITYLVSLLFLFTGSISAQVNFTFLPELYGRHVDGLGTFQVQNMGSEKISGRVFITVTENTSGAAVVTVVTPLFILQPGVTSFSKPLYSNSSFRFASTAYGAIAAQTRGIPPGDYTFCFLFMPQDKSRFAEHETCFDGDIQPLVPLTLLNPAHLDTICNKRPVLSWQPPMPTSAAMRFRLLLTEKKYGNPAEDLLVKAPLLLLDNISSPVINYPSVNPELKEGGTYYWQVVAYEKGVIISKSEIWEFTVQCREKVKPAPNESYRELKLLVNGNYYIANRTLRFAFRNNYNVQKLNYSIVDYADGGKRIKHVPEVKLQFGLNKIDIDLTDLDLEPGHHYVLKVYPFNELPVEIRFIYKDNDISEQ
jgi:hypothetical protein